MYIKDFDGWSFVKKEIQSGRSGIKIRAGEIRWVALGINIGSEIDGKGAAFTRPALILHVIGAHLALIVPMSTKIKNIPGYIPLSWRGQTTSLCIHQLRIVSSKRILVRKGRISRLKLKIVKDAVTRFFSLSDLVGFQVGELE